MFFTQDRAQIRQFYVTAWQKQRRGTPMEPSETLISDVIALHPEYHTLLEKGGDVLEKDYTPEMGETNPFLHMSLHVAIREQISTNRPAGIGAMHHQLVAKHGDAHRAEHEMMECLAEMLWHAQHKDAMPDETGYVECLKKRLKK